MKFLINLLFLCFFVSCTGNNNNTKKEIPADQNGQQTTENTKVTEVSDTEETLYTISLQILETLLPGPIVLTVNGKTLQFGPYFYPACVAVEKSELETLKIEVYDTDHSLITECSCANNKSVTNIRRCTSEFNNYIFLLLIEDLGDAVSWDCRFGVQTKQLPDASTCKRF